MIVTASLALAFAASPLQRDWPSAGPFDIYELEDECALHAEYPIPGRAPIKLSVMSGDGQTFLALSSTDWSARDGEAYTLKFDLGTISYSGAAVGAVAGHINKGFIAKMDDTFLDAFATAPDLYVTRERAVVAHLNLRGTAAAVSTLRRCVSHVDAASAARRAQEKRVDYISADPFAHTPQVSSDSADPANPPSVITNVTWSRQPRPVFPERARENGVTRGGVTLSCAVSRAGSLSNCSIVSESPAGMGFGREALSAVLRAQVSPTTADAATNGATARFRVEFTTP